MFLCFVNNEYMLQSLYQLHFIEQDLYEINILIFKISLVFGNILRVMFYHMLWFHFPWFE